MISYKDTALQIFLQ